MSERLEPTVDEDLSDEAPSQESWAAAEHYARMDIQAGHMGNDFYFSLPTFTILTKTQEELETISDEFAALLSKYTDQIIVGAPHEASLILSINQAASDLAVQNEAIAFLREKIHELTGSYDAAGGWEGEA